MNNGASASIAASLFMISAVYVGTVIHTAACSPTTTKGVEAVSIDLGVCILNHITEPPEQIAVTCGATSVEDVAKVIAAHKAAMVREGSALPPCGSR